MRFARTFALIAAVLVASVVGALLLDVAADRRCHLVVTEPTPVLLAPQPAGYGSPPVPNPVVGVLAPADSSQVLRIRYGKDFQAVRVRVTGNVTGWVITGPTAYIKRSR
jgi:hypothetical protein